MKVERKWYGKEGRRGVKGERKRRGEKERRNMRVKKTNLKFEANVILGIINIKFKKFPF